jgi:hypothetical protein
MNKPYVIEQRHDYFVVVDSRNGQLSSFPSSKSAARANAAVLNRAYAEAMAEEIHQC